MALRAQSACLCLLFTTLYLGYLSSSTALAFPPQLSMLKSAEVVPLSHKAQAAEAGPDMMGADQWAGGWMSERAEAMLMERARANYIYKN